MFTQLKYIIPKTVNRLGLKRQFDAAYICEMYRKIAAEVKGGVQFSNPKSFKNGILYIFVENSAYAQQVFMNRKRIIEKINSELKNEVVKEIRTEVKFEF